MLLLPIRTLLIPRMSFTKEELAILDRPTASAFVSSSTFMCTIYIYIYSPFLLIGFTFLIA